MEKLDWKEISKQSDLSDSFLQEHKGMLHWKLLSQYRTFTKESVTAFKDYVNWENICKYQACLDVSCILENIRYVHFSSLSANPHLKEEVVEKFIEYLDWGSMYFYNRKLFLSYKEYGESKLNWEHFHFIANERGKLNKQFLEDFKHTLNWTKMLTECDVNEFLVEDFKGYIDWKELSTHANRLREHFISFFREELYWEEISKNIPAINPLSFVREYVYKLHIPSLLTCNNLSSNVLELLFEHDCIDWDLVAIYQKPHAQFTEKYIQYLDVKKMYEHHEPMYSDRKWKELKRLKKEKGSIPTRKRKG